MHYLPIIVLNIVLFVFLSCTSNRSNHNELLSPTDTIPPIDTLSFRNKAKEAQAFIAQKSYNDQFCILIDLSIHSGLPRFIEWDFMGDSIKSATLVSHGCADAPWGKDHTKEHPQFSNTENSHASSLGKYKIGARGPSSWGIKVKYIMHGLDSSNSNAVTRVIVFHSWDAVTDSILYPKGTIEGWGCPAVSDNYMRYIDPRLKASKQPVLMWIYANK